MSTPRPRYDLDDGDDDDVGLPAALAVLLLLIGLAVGFFFAMWLAAMHLAGQGRLPW